jgi:predicted DNA-binding protein with PD1-like motif
VDGDEQEAIVNAKLLHSNGEKTYALVFDIGDEVLEELIAFAREKDLNAAHITAIGAFHDVTLGYFDWEKKDYKKIEVNEQVEVLSLIGDIAEDAETHEPKIHLHTVLGRSDGSTVGGHLFEGHVRPTLEVILTETPTELRRKSDSRTGLALISI